MVRVPPLPARSARTGRGPATVEETVRVSAGAGARGRTGAATAQAQALDRFTRVIEMLDRMVLDGAIASHVEVAPPRSQAARRPCHAAPGSLAVWAFPEIPVIAAVGVERWYMRSFRHRPPSYADVRRTAMVRSIVVGASVVHWIETKPRGPGQCPEQGAYLTTVVTGLVELAAGAQGVRNTRDLEGWPVSEGDTCLLCHERGPE